MVYRKDGKVYRAHERNLEPDPQTELWPDQPARELPVTPGKTKATAAAHPKTAPAKSTKPHANKPSKNEPVVVYADGACSGNPGPAGLGVVILLDGKREEISEYLGEGTNNVAELTAIVRALERLPRARTILLHSDSAYALGLLGKGWKAKANRELVEKMRGLAREFSDLRLIKVEGHAGIAENERADALARQGVSEGTKAP